MHEGGGGGKMKRTLIFLSVYQFLLQLSTVVTIFRESNEPLSDHKKQPRIWVLCSMAGFTHQRLLLCIKEKLWKLLRLSYWLLHAEDMKGSSTYRIIRASCERWGVPPGEAGGSCDGKASLGCFVGPTALALIRIWHLKITTEIIQLQSISYF